jgi:hypothetical protein
MTSSELSLWQRIKRAPNLYSHQLIWVVLVHSLRGSLLIGGAMLIVSSTGTWRFFASSFTAHDMRRAAVWSQDNVSSNVVMVAIDDVGYDSFFGGQSPLQPDRLVRLARAVDEGATAAKAIVVDLDLSPAPGANATTLPTFFAGVRPGRWIVADPGNGDSPTAPAKLAWQDEVCKAGARFAHPFVPTQFGYAQGTHQFPGGLAQAALQPEFDCAAHHALAGTTDSAGNYRLKRVAAPLSAQYLNNGLVIPFQGDLEALKATLDALQPQFVVLGGTWGRQDVIGTPFGERFGLHQHAAAIDGALQRATLAPNVVQLAWAWMVLSVLSLVLSVCQKILNIAVEPWTSGYPGHRFLLQHLWPLLAVCISIACLLLVSEAGAILRARTGYLLPSATVAAVTLISLLLIWNWGRTPIARYDGAGLTWKMVVTNPIRADWVSMVNGWRQWRGKSATTPPASALLHPPLSSKRALAECMLAACALFAQTALPMLSLAYAISKPL